MVRPQDYVVWLKDIDKEDHPYVGGKNANLGEMIQAGFPVPGGFAITAFAYFEFLKANKLDIQIKHLLASVNFSNHDSLSQVTKQIRKLLLTSPIPKVVVDAVFDFYEKLKDGGKEPLLAIRSSATSEDSKQASFAGQQETFLNITGEAAVMESVRRAWASLFEERAVFYRHDQKLDHLRSGISLVVQEMIESDTSGVMFTIDPITNDKGKIIIEAIFGLGEFIVQGRVTPDHYEVKKSDLSIIQKQIRIQTVKMVKAKKENKEVSLNVKTGGEQKITDTQIIEIAKLGKAIEKHYYFPQDIEWAIEKSKVYIVQTRPITTLGNEKLKMKNEKLSFISHLSTPILIGDPACPGIGIGPVTIIHSANEIGKVKKGDILVAPFTNPDYVPAMKIAAGIITERGGRTSHAAIVAREFGIPAIVGTVNATKMLKTGDMVTVNGTKGEVYKGSILVHEKIKIDEHLETKTKVYVNLSEPELAEKIALQNVDGIGLLRAEFMVAQIGVHPKKLIADGKGHVFTDKLAEGLETICKAFYPRPVIYRATDFKTNEYKTLIGGKEFEPVESNPMLGYRGAFRYIHDKRTFELELKAIKKVREKLGLVNLQLMIPFVRTVNELKKVKEIVNESGLKRSGTFKLHMMVEIPSNVILLDNFIKVGIDGVSIGSNDLTMLILGVDRDNEEVAMEFDERDRAVMWALERIIKVAKRNGITASICGQAPSNFPHMVEELVKWGITSISVSPDAISETRKTIFTTEKGLNK